MGSLTGTGAIRDLLGVSRYSPLLGMTEVVHVLFGAGPSGQLGDAAAAAAINAGPLSMATLQRRLPPLVFGD